MQRLPAKTLALARALRREHTDAEGVLWSLLRNRNLGGFKFRRQKAFPPYVVDFYCAETALAIEVDGSHHGEAATFEHDTRRTEALSARGVRVLRFWNQEVLHDTERVLEAIWLALGAGDRTKI